MLRNYRENQMHKLAGSWQQSTRTSNDSARRTRIAELAKILLGCYRTGDANDPAIYAGAIIAVLSDYPLDVIEAAVDPRTGLPAQSKWLPTVAEVKDFCEARMIPRRMQAQGLRQLEEREQLAIEHQWPRKTYAQLCAECRAVGINIGPKGPSHAVDVVAVRQQYGISQEQWDAIPDAPK
jgi:hypothetical protein